jgi:hypothetical protein
MRTLTGNDISRYCFCVMGIYVLAFYGASLVGLATDAGAILLTGGKIMSIAFNPLFFDHAVLSYPFTPSAGLVQEYVGFLNIILISLVLVWLGRFCPPVLSWVPAIGVVAILGRASDLLWDKSYHYSQVKQGLRNL